MTTIFGIHYDENNAFHRAVTTMLLIVASLTIFLVVWWDISLIVDMASVPSPGRTLDALVDLVNNGDQMTKKTLWNYIGASMSTFLKGFLLALALAVPVGLLLGYSKFLRDISNPIIEILRPIAPIAWAPILIMMPGLGYTKGPIIVVFIGIFFPLLTNIIFGVKKIEPNWIDAAKTLGSSQTQIFYKVMMPAAIPYLMNGVKVGLGVGWMCIVAAELYASPLGGIGFYLAEQSTAGYWPGAFAALVVIAILGLLTIGVADYVHRVLSKRMGMDV
ncbi:MAG: ABC transporter permease [Candidatus Methanoplasma sp.]|jgi:NitT/TauT family transport system permease protein|nr:ABC transporter permease [Candidatus Methanoplasma sp.]